MLKKNYNGRHNDNYGNNDNNYSIHMKYDNNCVK